MLAAALVHIGVFGLFHPSELEVRPAPGGVLVLRSQGGTQTLEGGHAGRIRSAAMVTGRDGAMARFTLSVPGRIRRQFEGRLEVRPAKGELLAIVEMEMETAVASAVAAEFDKGPIEALKAQAVASRSFLMASHNHEGFDSCDTTHCQYMRNPPPPGSPAGRATESTRSLAIVYQGKVIPAVYSANCGGHTISLKEAGWADQDYPYFGVSCPIKGTVSGHRIGLCQAGAAELAKRGATFREILSYFFPATVVEARPYIAEPSP